VSQGYLDWSVISTAGRNLGVQNGSKISPSGRDDNSFARHDTGWKMNRLDEECCKLFFKAGGYERKN